MAAAFNPGDVQERLHDCKWLEKHVLVIGNDLRPCTNEGLALETEQTVHAILPDPRCCHPRSYRPAPSSVYGCCICPRSP